MTIESLLLSIEGSLAIGFAIGVIVGLTVARPKLGCFVLLTVPVAMIGYVNWWHGAHPENLRSTSALDFIFGPLWPSLGAIAGYYAGRSLRSLITRR